MKLKQLEIILQRVCGFSHPSPDREQYQTPAPLAARLLYMALTEGNIEGREILDLGCGTGILSVGAALLGGEVTGVEYDHEALQIAAMNASDLGCIIKFIQGDINNKETLDLIPEADTVIMNPPFGAQNEHADRPFIDAALEKGTIVYGIFNHGSAKFLEVYIKDRAEIINSVMTGLTIPKTFWFHTREKREFPVEIHVLRRL